MRDTVTQISTSEVKCDMTTTEYEYEYALDQYYLDRHDLNGTAILISL